jgi:NADH:ubiquinone oxidoreductase subunit H
MIIAIIVAFYEQSLDKKNVYIQVISIVVFMIGMMKLSAKVPSKNPEKEEDNV